MRSFGRIHMPDDRDRNYAIRAKSARKLPTQKHWSEGPPQYQYETPHCAGFTGSDWLACSPIRQWLDPHGLYSLAQCVDEWPGEDYEGTSVRAVAEVLDRLGFIKQYRWAFSIDAVISAVLTQGPVMFGSDWYEDMSEPDERGVIQVGGEIEGGHAYLLSGYSRRTNLFRIRNHWKGWGVDGVSRAYIHADDVKQLLADQGEACLGIERKAKL